MGILFVFVLSLCVSFVLSDPPSSIICAYGGSPGIGTLVVDEIPPRCQAILYSGNMYDVTPTTEDKNAISELKKANQTVYMLYFSSANVDWNKIVSDPACLESHIKPMVTFLIDNKVDGVFLNYLELQGGKIPDYSNKIKTFVDIIKKCVPSIIVGLWVDGAHADKFADTNLFDFSVTNVNVDLYVIDTANAGFGCEANVTANGGRHPVSLIESINSATASSKMDQNKIFMNLVDLASKSLGKTDELLTYTDYCCKSDSSIWCVDTIQQLYDQVITLHKVFKGIVISYLDYDDTKDACQCDKYVIANTFMDAWEKKPMKCCEKIG